jgi:hypothetical protein
MDLEALGFALGLIGAVLMKASMRRLRQPPAHAELEISLGREPENPALKTFVRGLGLVLAGLAIETCARIFFP